MPRSSSMKKLCKNNYVEFLEALQTVQDVQASVKEIRSEVVVMQKTVAKLEAENLKQAKASLDLKLSYYEQTRKIEEAEYAKVSKYFKFALEDG